MLAAYILLNERRWWTISTFIKTNTQRRHTDEETGEDVTIISLHKELKKLSEQLGK